MSDLTLVSVSELENCVKANYSKEDGWNSKNSQNGQNLGLFWKKDWVSWKKNDFFQNCLKAAKLLSNVRKICFGNVISTLIVKFFEEKSEHF